jgi:hypothetical protein
MNQQTPLIQLDSTPTVLRIPFLQFAICFGYFIYYAKEAYLTVAIVGLFEESDDSDKGDLWPFVILSVLNIISTTFLLLFHWWNTRHTVIFEAAKRNGVIIHFNQHMRFILPGLVIVSSAVGLSLVLVLHRSLFRNLSFLLSLVGFMLSQWKNAYDEFRSSNGMV